MRERTRDDVARALEPHAHDARARVLAVDDLGRRPDVAAGALDPHLESDLHGCGWASTEPQAEPLAPRGPCRRAAGASRAAGRCGNERAPAWRSAGGEGESASPPASTRDGRKAQTGRAEIFTLYGQLHRSLCFTLASRFFRRACHKRGHSRCNAR